MLVNTCDAVITNGIGNFTRLDSSQGAHEETPSDFVFVLCADIIDIESGIRWASTIDLHV